MKPDQLPLSHFLKDKQFKKFFSKQPTLSVNQSNGKRPWRIYVQSTEDSSWKKGDVPTYKVAFTHAKKLLSKGVYDLTICSRSRAYWPPIIRGQVWANYPTTHLWCPFCRRPTIFWHFRKHHALPNPLIDLSIDPRCQICGNRADNYARRYQRRV